MALLYGRVITCLHACKGLVSSVGWVIIRLQPNEVTLYTPVVVIGTGISGLFTALKLADSGCPVILLTKTNLGENNSRYAQGGIAAVLPDNTDDSLESHVQDTLLAGDGLCNEAVVRSLLADGHEAILDLLDYGVPFDKTADNQLALGQEAAHSTRRILHAGGDATGLSVELALIERLKAHTNITVEEHALVTRLLVSRRADGTPQANGCAFLRLVPSATVGETLPEVVLQADYTVLATGGVGQLYSHTTNPAIATGDGLALAQQALQHLSPAGSLADLAFLQFHPTAFYHDGQTRFLISEAVRGEGAILTNSNGNPFAKHYHPKAELAPRDIVSRAIFTEIQQTGVAHVWLDMSHLPASTIEHRFPSILKACLGYGVDPRVAPIPVAPAAHYMMGGVPVDVNGHSQLAHLFVVGEAACTGLHGANRLASNSLLECVVLARRVAATISQQHAHTLSPTITKTTVDTPPPARYSILTPADGAYQAITNRTTDLRKLMWEHVGIVRTRTGLQFAINMLQQWHQQAINNHWDTMAPYGTVLVNSLVLGQLMAQTALALPHSQGAHYLATDKSTQDRPFSSHGH
jgi:L-aspartate oxidase